MARRKKGEAVSGWINIDKPYGMTSTQAVGKVRRLLNAQKVGHAGTLDPLATGVLPIALGEATKTIPFAQDDLKTYSFTITWGEQRTTDDIEGEVIATSSHRPTHTDIQSALCHFTGEIQQTPPCFSAIKIKGERAYNIARTGSIPDLKPRSVYVKELEFIRGEKDFSHFKMICGKGTYVRSIARDMGEKLGTKGYISALRREQVGIFTTKNTISLDSLEQMDYISARTGALLPLSVVLDDIPALTLSGEETTKLRNGQVLQFVSKPDFQRLINVGLGEKTRQTALAIYQGEPVALVEQERASVKPYRVFNI